MPAPKLDAPLIEAFDRSMAAILRVDTGEGPLVEPMLVGVAHIVPSFAQLPRSQQFELLGEYLALSEDAAAQHELLSLFDRIRSRAC